MRPEPEEQPWERCELDATDLQWSAFLAYRDLPPENRTCVEVSRVTGMHVSFARRLCRDNLWRERVQAYEKYLDREACRIRLGDTRKAAKRHAELARGLQEAMASQARALLEECRRPGAVRTVSVRDLVRGAEVSVKLERLVSGQSTEHTELDLGGLTEEQIEELRKLTVLAGG